MMLQCFLWQFTHFSGILLCCCAAAPGNYSYYTNTSNLTYVLSTYNRTSADSNTLCRLYGGSLVTYKCVMHAH
jgi:hypothetical protein